MALIVVLTMQQAQHDAELGALREAGHELTVVEPRWPECQASLGGARPQLVLVDGHHQPSHGRATAGWMACQARYRTVPFLFLDVADRDIARVKKEVPRAQFGTWSGVVGASERLARRAE